MLVGPTSPRDVADLLAGRDQGLAESIPGYRGTSVSGLARALVAAGSVVEIATTAADIAERMTLEGERFRLHLIPMRQSARSRAADMCRMERRGLEKVIRSSEADVIHAQWTYEFAWAALDGGRPVVVTARDAPLTILGHYRDRYRAMRTAMAFIVRFRTRALTVPSPYLAQAWRRQMLYRRPIAILPNIVWPAPTSSSEATPAAPIILEVADDSERKNVDVLISAMQRILRCHPDARLRLIGSGLTENSSLARLADRCKVRHAVQFLGPMDRAQLREEYSRATMFVHASREESFGNSVAEAMAYGLPVVAGEEAGAVPWVLDEGRVGLLVDITEPDAIARAVSELIADDRRCAVLGAAAALRARSLFSPSAVADNWIRMYTGLKDAHP